MFARSTILLAFVALAFCVGTSDAAPSSSHSVINLARGQHKGGSDEQPKEPPAPGSDGTDSEATEVKIKVVEDLTKYATACDGASGAGLAVSGDESAW